ncbi:MAG: hypothetical protein IH945_05690 [Armatimonadetes bacterium]|nr:hypothetical protein [Armatimonadota bacterium]
MSLTALILAAALAPQDAYALKWRPERGGVSVYDLFVDGAGGTIGGSVEAALEHRVVDVRSDGSYSIRSRSLGAIVRMDGGEIKDDRPNVRTAKFDSFGHLTELVGGRQELESYRQILLTTFVSPPGNVAVGGSWRYDREKERPKGLAACRIEYKLLAVEDGSARVSFRFTELEGTAAQTAEGTWWIDVKSGQATKMEAKVANYLGTSGASANVRLTRR